MKFFCLPNLTTDHVTVSEKPWEDFPMRPGFGAFY